MTSALLVDFLSSEYSSFFRPIVRRRDSSGLFVGNRPSESDHQHGKARPLRRHTVKYDLDIGRHCRRRTRALVQKLLTLFSLHRRVLVGENESDC